MNNRQINEELHLCDEVPVGTRNGPWSIQERQVVYHDPWMKVRRDIVVRPDGGDGTYSTVQIKAGVCVVAIDDEGYVYLTQEFHYAVGRATIEGVSGGIEQGESALLAATRELREEIGIVASSFRDLGQVDPLTAALWSPTRLFWATELEFVEAAPEATEQIDMVRISLDEAVQMVLDGQITHGPTCVAILKIHVLKQNQAQGKGLA